MLLDERDDPLTFLLLGDLSVTHRKPGRVRWQVTYRVVHDRGLRRLDALQEELSFVAFTLVASVPGPQVSRDDQDERHGERSLDHSKYPLTVTSPRMTCDAVAVPTGHCMIT